MARSAVQFVCQSCGGAHPKWSGKCEACGEWNTLVEESVSAPVGTQATKPKTRKPGRGIEFVDLGAETEDAPRFSTGVSELDRVLGGGLVPGSAVLIGGDPGIGKSTLLLQAMASLASDGVRTAYISGEEAVDQVRRRAKRLGLSDSPVALASETALEPTLDALKRDKPQVVVVDSIQTLWTDQLAAAPGTVAQVRACSQELVRFAKRRNAAVILVGHVTKEGQIAGPRVVEHMVDAVIYFEGERAHQFRLLRSVKNRFGPTDEIGVFEMSEQGLTVVENPSALFLDGRGEPAPGSAVFAGMEGARPVLVEIQALVASAAFGTPRRAVVGWDSGRLAMVLAVLEARCGLGFGQRDVYLNVAGGLKISEPAADLAVAAALASSVFDVALPADCAAFGEISLSGEVRPVGRADARMKEAAKLGFQRAIAPVSPDSGANLSVLGVKTLADLVAMVEAGQFGED
ncbi:DNA repair protein RadA [Euryhalocaulis caribicus]|uniref:DNA repair protein RadA n=1 Tax=Euryhalocaulis caribicus TaxID=1161401 RepID=UPI0003A76DA7|nr:DNA repair protein RadA [Euryhalocaulis caribicus]